MAFYVYILTSNKFQQLEAKTTDPKATEIPLDRRDLLGICLIDKIPIHHVLPFIWIEVKFCFVK